MTFISGHDIVIVPGAVLQICLWPGMNKRPQQISSLGFKEEERAVYNTARRLAARLGTTTRFMTENKYAAIP